ncbi:hypothetical protein CPC197_0547A, partial [Chlamydia psittaci C1/97]|jgi:hypothetical protein
MPHT